MENVITKEEWQSGNFRKREDCKTQEGYYKAVEAFVEKYGEPINQDLVLCRNGFKSEWKRGFGCSFTTNANVCRKHAKLYSRDRIWWLFVPKGTKAVYLPVNGFFEEEFVLPIHKMKLSRKNFGVLARHDLPFDYSSDYETEYDFKTWKLNYTRSILAIDNEAFVYFYNDNDNEEDSLIRNYYKQNKADTTAA